MKYYYIYKITNKINHKIYYGQHTTSNLDDYMGSGKALHNAFKKYGKENFEKKISETLKGKKRSNESKRKMSEVRNLYWQKKKNQGN